MRISNNDIRMYDQLTIASNTGESTPAIRFSHQNTTGLFTNTTSANHPVMRFATGGVEAASLDSYGNFYVVGNIEPTGQVRLSEGTEENPGITFANDTNTGWYRGAADRWNFRVGGTSSIMEMKLGMFTVQSSMRIDNGLIGQPGLAFSANTNTGIGQVSGGDDSIAFATDGAYAGHFDVLKNFHVANDIFGENDLHIARELDAQVGFFYTSLHIGSSTSESEANMWKIYPRTDGTHNLVISNEQGANDATPRLGNLLEIDAGILFWPNMPDAGPQTSFTPMIEFSATVNDLALLSPAPMLYHAPTITYAGNIAPEQAGITFEGTYEQSSSTIFTGSSGLKFDRTTSIVDYDDDLVMGNIIEITETHLWDNCDFSTAKGSWAVSDAPAYLYANGSVSLLGGDYGSFRSKPGGGGDASADSSLTMNKFVAFHGAAMSSLSGSLYFHLGLHRYIQLDQDDKAELVEGIYSNIDEIGSESTENVFINHVGDAPSSFGGTITAPAFNLTSPETYTTSDYSVDRTLAAGTDGLEAVADVLATLIEDLKTAGILT
jgi:hypothetical protein